MKKNLFFLLLLIANHIGYGQDDFRHLSWKDGLSSNKTYQSVEDTEGFIWVSTDEGVDRFDGRDFTHYELELHEEISSYGYLFYHMLIDEHNNIFVVSNHGHVFRLNRNLDLFERVIEFEPYYERYIFSSFIDGDNHLLLSTPNNIIVYDYEAKTIIKRQFPESVYSIIKFEDGFLLGGSSTLYKLSADFKNSSPVGNWDEKLGGDIHFRTLLHDSKNNRIWLGSSKEGLFYFDLTTQQYHTSGLGNLINEFPVWDIVKANDSTMLVGTDGAGVIKVSLTNLKIVAAYSTDPDDDKAISSNVIHDILVCKNSVYFIATNMGGVNILNPLKPIFSTIKNKPSLPNTIGNNVIHSIEELPGGEVAFGTDKGVYVFNPKRDRWRMLGENSTDGKNNVVTSIESQEDGSLWIGYFIRETQLISKNGSRIDVPDPIKQSKNSKSMYFDEESKTLWMGHEGQSLRLLSYNFSTHTNHTFSIEEVSSIVSYRNKKILVGTHSGLYIFDKYSNEYQKYNQLSDKLNRVTCLLVDRSDRLWVGSNGGGIAMINLATEEKLLYNDTKGLPSARIYSLVEDTLGNIWAATDLGLSRINPKQQKIVNYYESDGIASVDFMNNSICKSSDGLIYVGSTGGVTVFDPKLISDPLEVNNLVFTNLFINQKKIIADGSVLKQPLENTENIELNYDQNSFAIEFSNIDFIHPEQARYVWKLEGVDRDWNAKNATGRAVYSNLNPGEYVFRVRNRPSSSSSVGSTERILHISIRNPIWKTPVAFVVYAIIIIAIILFGLYYNKLMHDVRSSKDRLKYLVNLAHEIKTPLSLIRAPIGDLLQENKEGASSEKLAMAMRNVEKLQKRIGQFLDFRRINQIVDVQSEKIEIIGFLRKKISAFRLLAERNKIQLNFESSIEDLFIYSDPEFLDKIINNLLSNAIKYNIAGGYVNLRLHKEDEFIKISITDSGIGIPKKEQKNIFKLFFRASTALSSSKTGSGVGLVLTKDLVNLLKGTISFESSEGKGSSFYFKIPIGQPNLHEEDHSSELVELLDSDSEEENISSTEFKVLVVEDDEDLRSYIKQQLQKKYTVIEATNGHTGLEIAKQKLPDLILSDVAMPQMNGRQLCMNLKSQSSTSHIPVILLSGLDSKEHILQGISAGADDYVSKPFDSSILFAKIESLLNNRKKLKTKFINSEQGAIDVDFQNDLDKNFINQITKLVEENIADSDLSIRMLLTSVGMSRTAFYHKLKSLIDLSPAEFIRSVRLNKAKQLLRSKKYHINEVAYRCGFSDSKYFSTSFKRQFGQSPSAYISSLTI